MIIETERGLSYPLGATVTPSGVNFSVFSKNATGMELLLFDGVDDSKPSAVIKFDPKKNKTYDYWHLFVDGLKAGQLYAIVPMDHLNRSKVIGSILIKCCSIPTAVVLQFRRNIAGLQPVCRVIMPLSP